MYLNYKRVPVKEERKVSKLEEKLIYMTYLVNAVRDSVSWIVVDLGQGSLTDGWGDNGNWSGNGRVSEWSVDSGVSEWGSIGKVAVADKVGISEGSNRWVSNHVGVSEGRDSWLANNAGISKGGWDDSRGDDSTLLSSGSGESLGVSNSVGSLGLSNLRGVLNWSWGDQVGNNWGSWSDRESVGSNTESSTIGNVFNADFLSLGVDVGVRSANVSGSVSHLKLKITGCYSIAANNFKIMTCILMQLM